MLTSTAVVPTDAAARYAKQLLAHLGRKAGVEPVDGEPDGGLLRLSPAPASSGRGPTTWSSRRRPRTTESLAVGRGRPRPPPRALRRPPRADRHLAAGRRLIRRRETGRRARRAARLPGSSDAARRPDPAPSAW